jgi:hypothetical protein
VLLTVVRYSEGEKEEEINFEPEMPGILDEKNNFSRSINIHYF